MSGLNQQETYMQLALKLALKGQGRTSPNPLVGAVIVKDGKIIGQGWHAACGQAHAEIAALQDAAAGGYEVQGADIYVNLEPCCHQGRTGPCTKALIKAGIGRVFAAMTDPNPQVAGQGFSQLQAAGITVTCGILEQQARELNEVFCHWQRWHKPFVVVKAAMTLDGKIACSSGDSRWISGEQSRELVHQLRSQYDLILTGRGTVVRDDPQLTVRLPQGGRNPAVLLLDSQARISPQARCLQQVPQEAAAAEPMSAGSLADAAGKGAAGKNAAGKNAAVNRRVIVAVQEGLAPQSRLSLLQQQGAETWRLPAGSKAAAGAEANDTFAAAAVNAAARTDKADSACISLPHLMNRLAAENICSVLVEAGPTVMASLFQEQLVSKVLWFIAPKLVGGRQAPGPVGGQGIACMNEALKLHNISYRQVAEDMLVTGYLSAAAPTAEER